MISQCLGIDNLIDVWFVLATKRLFSDSQAFASFSKSSGYQAVEPFLVTKHIEGMGLLGEGYGA